MDIEAAIFETGSQSAYPYTMQPGQSKVDESESKFTVYKHIIPKLSVNNTNYRNKK